MVLERSGWLTDPPQVMVLDGDQLHWTRWHQAMQRLERELIERSHAQPSLRQTTSCPCSDVARPQHQSTLKR